MAKNLTIRSVLAEFVNDCDAVGDEHIEQRWPDLKITLDKARDVLSVIPADALTQREYAIVLYALRKLQCDISPKPCPAPTLAEYDLRKKINVAEIHTLCEKINLG